MNLNPIKFNVYRNDNCCGMLEIGGFEQPGPSIYYKPKAFSSLEDLFTDFEERLLTNICDAISDNSKYTNGTYLLTLSLVDAYAGVSGDRSKQLPEFANYLLSSGWSKTFTFLNRNTNNIVAVYHRMLTDVELIEAGSVDNEEEENDW